MGHLRVETYSKSKFKLKMGSKFKAFGCGTAIAASSLVTEWIKGKTLNYAKHLRLPPVKIHCSALSEDSIKAAIHDYKTKNNIP